MGALVAMLAAMVCLSWFAWSTIAAAGTAGERTHAATAEAGRFQRASAALERLQAAETTWVLTPELPGTEVELERSRTLLHASIASIRAQAHDAASRAAAASLAADAAGVSRGIVRLRSAIQGAYGGDVVSVEKRYVRRPIDAMRGLIRRQVARYSRLADANLAASRRANARLGAVAVITAVLAAAVTAAVLRMILLRRRLAEVHRREVERLRLAALRDSLTGLRNHRSFQEDLRLAISERRVEHLLVVDLDGLKATNDDHGHKAGDEMIVKLAEALEAVASRCGSAYRIGGDEFAMIVTRGDADRVAAEIHQACKRSSDPAPEATVGIGTWEDGVEADELVRRADLALITAKPEGISTRRYTAALEAGSSRGDVERAQLEAVLRTPRAIAPVFQPIFDLRTREVVGYEALTRFAGGSDRPTEEWFELARRHNLAVELEAAAVRAALLVPDRPAGVSLSLNISPEVLLAGRHRLGLPRDLSEITIEVTENALVTGGLDLELALQDLRSRGARIAVDDAGAGYAGFAQLVRVRPDIVKLDRSLVRNVNTEPAKAAVIRAFVSFAQDTGALACAEGIETAGELRVVTELGAAIGQGYLLGRPKPEWLAPPPIELPQRTGQANGGVVALRPAASA